MNVRPEAAIWMAWLAWVVSWWLAAIWSRRAVSRAGRQAEWLHLALTISGFLLISSTRPNPDDPVQQVSTYMRLHYPPLQLWSTPTEVGWALFGLAVLGFLFCWWARLHLGLLWSGNVTLKADHRIVDTGPYRLVRHPIYTGLILAAAATALNKGCAWGLAGVALIVAGFWTKARLEERFLRSKLGPEGYDAYAARTPMLLPHPSLKRT